MPKSSKPALRAISKDLAPAAENRRLARSCEKIAPLSSPNPMPQPNSTSFPISNSITLGDGPKSNAPCANRSPGKRDKRHIFKPMSIKLNSTTTSHRRGKKRKSHTTSFSIRFAKAMRRIHPIPIRRRKRLRAAAVRDSSRSKPYTTLSV